MTIKVLIVDDSALVRKLLSEMLGRDRDIEVVGAAADPYAAREKIKQLNPDVITLDVEMPRMDGLTFLENLMRLRPMPVVMVSSLTQQGADVTLRALELGAVDFVAKPKIDVAGSLTDYADELIAKVKMAAGARVNARASPRPGRPSESIRVAAPTPCCPRRRRGACCARPIASSRSAPRPAAPKRFARCSAALPPDAPAIVISQHIPAAFSKPFAERMNRCSRDVGVRSLRTASTSCPATSTSRPAISICWSSATARAIAVG